MGVNGLNKISFSTNTFFIGEENNELAKITFVPTGENKIIIDHTYVSEAARGQGLGEQLVERVVQYARENNKKIIPLCPFAKLQIGKNPEFSDVL